MTLHVLTLVTLGCIGYLQNSCCLPDFPLIVRSATFVQNLRVIAKYYTKITTKRLVQLLGLDQSVRLCRHVSWLF